jgi:hypothetical protein
LSTLVLEGSSEAEAGSPVDGESPGQGDYLAPAAVRFADLIVLAIALPIFLVFGFSILGYAVCAAAWVLGRALHLAAERRAAAALKGGNRKAAMGTMGAATLARVWLLALSILIVGLSDRKAGLSGALLAVAVVTTYFAAQGVAYALEPEEGP